MDQRPLGSVAIASIAHGVQPSYFLALPCQTHPSVSLDRRGRASMLGEEAVCSAPEFGPDFCSPPRHCSQDDRSWLALRQDREDHPVFRGSNQKPSEVWRKGTNFFGILFLFIFSLFCILFISLYSPHCFLMERLYYYPVVQKGKEKA